MLPTEAHPREQLHLKLFPGTHTGPLDTQRAQRLMFHGCSFSLLQPRCLGWLHGFGKASGQGPVLKYSPQEGSQRWQKRVVYVAMIPQTK